MSATYTPKLSHEQRLERRMVMAELVGSGHAVNVVANQYDVSPACVFKACKEFGVGLKKGLLGIAPELKAAIAEAVRGGKSALDASIEFGVSHSHVLRICHENHVPLYQGPHGPLNANAIVTRAEWEAADWELRDTDLATQFGVCRERVRQVRKMLKKDKSPCHRTSSSDRSLLNWIEQNFELARTTAACDLPALIPFAVKYEQVINGLRKSGIRPAGRTRVQDRITKENLRSLVNETAEGCWEWIERNTKMGYPRIGKAPAHHFVFRLFKGEIPAGLWVLHTCDNPVCVNPAHLYAGTAQDNANDRTRNGNSRSNFITPEQVREIRWLRAKNGLSFPSIAKQFGISAQTVYLIVRKKIHDKVTDAA